MKENTLISGAQRGPISLALDIYLKSDSTRALCMCKDSVDLQVITSVNTPHHQIAGGGDGEEEGGKQTVVRKVGLNGKVLRGREMGLLPPCQDTLLHLNERICHRIFRQRDYSCLKSLYLLIDQDYSQSPATKKKFGSFEMVLLT